MSKRAVVRVSWIISSIVLIVLTVLLCCKNVLRANYHHTPLVCTLSVLFPKKCGVKRSSVHYVHCNLDYDIQDCFGRTADMATTFIEVSITPQPAVTTGSSDAH